MNFKDLEAMRISLSRNYNEVPMGLYVDGSPGAINNTDALFLAHYKTITDYLIKKNLISDTRAEIDFVLLEKDSSPMEEDYL